MNLSGRGDKDVDTAAKWFGMIGEGESAEDADGTAIARGDDPGRADTSFAEPGAQTEGSQL